MKRGYHFSAEVSNETFHTCTNVQRAVVEKWTEMHVDFHVKRPLIYTHFKLGYVDRAQESPFGGYSVLSYDQTDRRRNNI
jgi:hypothetical protein